MVWTWVAGDGSIHSVEDRTTGGLRPSALRRRAPAPAAWETAAGLGNVFLDFFLKMGGELVDTLIG
jgi:hypothetical protein